MSKLIAALCALLSGQPAPLPAEGTFACTYNALGGGTNTFALTYDTRLGRAEMKYAPHFVTFKDGTVDVTTLQANPQVLSARMDANGLAHFETIAPNGWHWDHILKPDGSLWVNIINPPPNPLVPRLDANCERK
jgi:hypothetical protein